MAKEWKCLKHEFHRWFLILRVLHCKIETKLPVSLTKYTSVESISWEQGSFRKNCKICRHKCEMVRVCLRCPLEDHLFFPLTFIKTWLSPVNWMVHKTNINPCLHRALSLSGKKHTETCYHNKGREGYKRRNWEHLRSRVGTKVWTAFSPGKWCFSWEIKDEQEKSNLEKKG